MRQRLLTVVVQRLRSAMLELRGPQGDNLWMDNPPADNPLVDTPPGEQPPREQPSKIVINDNHRPLDPADLQILRLLRGLTVAILGLIAATPGLWGSPSEFPQVPLWIPAAGPGVTMVGLCLLLVSLGLCWQPLRNKRQFAYCRAGLGWGLWIGWGLLFLGSAQRLQPWAWQSWLLGGLIAVASVSQLRRGWRWLVVTMYVYSAIWKLDPGFLHEIAPRLLEPLWNVFPDRAGLAGSDWIARLVWVLPMGELFVAVALAVPRWRWWGLWSSLAMHSLLLGLLGPWGAQHSPGVLIWNLTLMCQNWWLFREPAPLPFEPLAAARSAPRLNQTLSLMFGNRLQDWVATFWMLAWSVWPATYAVGVADAWPAWAVYTPPLQKVLLWIPRDEVAQLPASARRALVEPELSDIQAVGGWGWDYQLLDPNRWSLQIQQVPSYPAPWLRQELARKLASQHDIRRGLVSITPRRFFWQRPSGSPRVIDMKTGRPYAQQ